MVLSIGSIVLGKDNWIRYVVSTPYNGCFTPNLNERYHFSKNPKSLFSRWHQSQVSNLIVGSSSLKYLCQG